MYILAIETTGATASVALADENGVFGYESSFEKLNHLQNLISMTKALLEKSQLTIENIDYIGVSEGPGSFTGIRIGVSTARGLGQALGIKIIPVPTLKTFAYNDINFKGIVCPIFDARRDQVYGGAYIWNETGSEILEIVEGNAYNIDELLIKLGETLKDNDIMFFGDGINIYEKQINLWASNLKNRNIKINFAGEDIRPQKASSVGEMALRILEKSGALYYDEVKPVYMRKAEAERKLEAGCLNV